MFQNEDDDEISIKGGSNYTFEDSINHIKQKNIKNLNDLLIKLENRLYTPINESEIVVSKPDLNDRRYMDEGYEAHYEPVSDKEILQWQKNFVYLDIKANSLNSQRDRHKECNEDDENDSYKDIPIRNYTSSDEKVSWIPNVPIDNLDNDLVIIGKKIDIKMIKDFEKNTSNSIENEDIIEPINISDGILEEIIEIDRIDNYIYNEIKNEIKINNNIEDNLRDIEIELKNNRILNKIDIIWKQIIYDIEPFLKDIIIEYDNIKK